MVRRVSMGPLDSPDHLVPKAQKAIKARLLKFLVTQDPREKLESLALKDKKEKMGQLVTWVSQETKVKMEKLALLEILAFLVPQDFQG